MVVFVLNSCQWIWIHVQLFFLLMFLYGMLLYGYQENLFHFRKVMQLYSEKAIWATDSSSLLSAGIQVGKMAVQLCLAHALKRSPPPQTFW